MEAKANGPSFKGGRVTDVPTNPMVTPLLTHFYQFTMAFDLYFRKNPFGGEFTVFAGLEECIKLIANFKLTEEEISFICESLPSSCEEDFVNYLLNIDCSDVEVYAISEGTIVFPKVPLLRVEGSVAVVQLLETPVLNLLNFASLVATNAARHRLVARKFKMLLEFGLRRARGPDGAISASKYCYIGGFDATRWIANIFSLDEIQDRSLHSSDGSSTPMANCWKISPLPSILCSGFGWRVLTIKRIQGRD
ncbi:Nicotinate phosphoribosyltransferase [Hibiscus syriacus]|uniref:nicotinate phosphoribosyltransferase n=1 Tax=Hibiscus syriacus TaxID=106335 RepID=A0A6A2WXN3_HIBSY|nr:Nicotinate phosphoribosyltransferase [Hibiscus syriacus]